MVAVKHAVVLFGNGLKMIELYRGFLIITLSGMLGLALFHPEPRFQLAIFLLALANALFLYR